MAQSTERSAQPTTSIGMRYIDFEEDGFHVVRDETNGCTTVVTSSRHVPGFSRELARRIVQRSMRGIESCTRPCFISERKWERAKATLVSKMATRIEDSGRALRDWSSNCRWTIVTASDDSALSVLWDTSMDWDHPKRRDEKLELADRVSIVLNATDASHWIGEVKASRKFVETEEWEAARKKREEQWEEDEEDEEHEEPEEPEEDEGEEEEEEEDEDANVEVI